MTREDALLLSPGDLVECLDNRGINYWKDKVELLALEVGVKYAVKQVIDCKPYGPIVLEGFEGWTFCHERFK